MQNERKSKFVLDKDDEEGITINKNNYSNISEESQQEMIGKYERKLRNYTDKTGKKVFKQKGDEKESAYRIRLLRESLGLTLQKMAGECGLPLGKYTRLEGAGTPHGTFISKEDATRICVAVLKKFGILVEPEWLLCITSETPASLLSTKAVQKRVEEYTKEFMINRGITDTISIFLEMQHMERIQGADRTTFVMVSDNRLNSKYQKGDYVGGLIVKPELYYLLNGQECIVSMKKEPDVKFIRTLYFKIPNYDTELIVNHTIVLLCTETKEPHIAHLDEIDKVWIIFYLRKNNEEFTNLIGIISSAE
jgi:transcriptional regulator with XRE-family HTH domain